MKKFMKTDMKISRTKTMRIFDVILFASVFAILAMTFAPGFFAKSEKSSAATGENTSISPNSGSTVGGNTVKISGNFCGRTKSFTDGNGEIYCAQDSLEFDKKQYIDIGETQIGNIELSAKFNYDQDETGKIAGALFLTRAEADWHADAKNSEFSFVAVDSGWRINFMTSDGQSNIVPATCASCVSNIMTVPTDTLQHEIKFSSETGTFNFDGNTAAIWTGAKPITTPPEEIYLGGSWTAVGDILNADFEGSISSFTFAKDGVPSINFVPACNLLTGACGMFNAVNSRFYKSDSDVPFTPIAPATFSVEIGGQKCENSRIISATELTCEVPPHVAGAVDVSLTESGNYFGTSVLSGGYTYLAPSENSRISDEIIPGAPNTGFAKSK